MSTPASTLPLPEGMAAPGIPKPPSDPAAQLEQLRHVGGVLQLGRCRGTWHLGSNHAIYIDGDAARSGEPLPHVPSPAAASPRP
ncbi:hypothetical protein [Streptomyces fulvoviolaceus]|uniref:hypothetical protein n=1 Tax=Streptomyces fulvoviolaceus TaxID=285535 RepID=UPI000A796F2F|nr:hypothetical protein [Streptomyces fulvoviolaceus]